MKATSDQDITTPAKSLFGRLSDFVFGYDFFISYCWADGRDYAVALAKQLQEQGFECFLDSSDYAKGDNWRDQGRRALKKTSRLILVGTPKALLSEPVQHELEIFSRLRRRILPIDFEGSLSNAPVDSPVTRHLTPDTLFITESSQTLHSGPSAATINAVRGTFNLLRQQQKRLRLFTLATIAFAAISMVTISLYSIASRRQEESMALAWGAQGESIFEANPVEGLYLAMDGRKTAPAGSHSLKKRLTGRVLRLAAQGRLTRIGTDILDAELTQDKQLFIARRHAKGEVLDATDQRMIQSLPQRIRQISTDKSGDYLIVEIRVSSGDSHFAIRRRDNGKLVGYRKHLSKEIPYIFPRGEARYFISDTGFSPRIQRLSDQSMIGQTGFDIMQFHYKPSWPVFALSYRDDENTRRPPDAELFDSHSGIVAHKFSTREIEYVENKSGNYRVIRFTRPHDGKVETTVYATASAYIVSANAELTLWHSGQRLTLADMPVKIFSGVIAGQQYLLLLYDERSEVWSVTDQQLLGKLPKLVTADFIPNHEGWLATPSTPGSESLLLKITSGQLVTRQLDVRLTRKKQRADAQGKYFIATTDAGEMQLRRVHDGSLVALSAPVRKFTFPRDKDTPLFAVHYKGSRSSEIRRIADTSLLHTFEHDGEAEVEFENGAFFIINYFESDDHDTPYLSELRRNTNATLVAAEDDKITHYISSPHGDILLLQTSDEEDGYLVVLLHSATGYHRLNITIGEVSRPVIFHPDPGQQIFVVRDSETKLAYIYSIRADSNNPSEAVTKRIGGSDKPVTHTEFFNAAQSDYLLMGTHEERLEIWSVNHNPHRIFESPVGLSGYLKLPGEGRFLLWYDDGRAYVIDVRLIDLSIAASESGETEAIGHYLDYVDEDLFKSHWLDTAIIDQQRASMQLD